MRIDLIWREMRSKVIFEHPKWTPAAILWKKIKVAYWSEMERNAIESDFRSSKMAAGGHFVKTFITNCVWIWNVEKCYQKWFSVIQNVRRGSFCERKVRKYKSCILIRNSEKCDRNWFSVIQNGHKTTSLVETIYRDACTLISVNYSEIRYLVSDITQHHSLCYM